MFRYKGEKKIIETDLYAKYLTKRKYHLIGAYRQLNDKIVEDKQKNRYCVVSLELKALNGVNKVVENENYDLLQLVHDKADMKRKYIFVSERKFNLDQNIEYYQKLNENESRSAYAYGRYQRLQIMESFNKRLHVSEYMMVEDKNLEGALRSLEQLYYVTVLQGEELILFLRNLNNGTF